VQKESLLHRHPVSIYFLLAYAISWVGSFILGAPKFLRGETMQPNDLWVIAIAMLLAPSVLGIGLTALIEGKCGVRDLLSDIKKIAIQSIVVGCPARLSLLDPGNPDRARHLRIHRL